MTTEQETTIEETVEAEGKDEVEDQGLALVMARAELEHLRPLALRETIRNVGFDPDSSAGKVLAELAKNDASLEKSPRTLRNKAVELGLTDAANNTPSQPGSQPTGPDEVWWEDPWLTDTRYPADHPRNQVGHQANKQAHQDARRAKLALVLAEGDDEIPANAAHLEELRNRLTEAEAAGNHQLARQLKNRYEEARADPEIDGIDRRDRSRINVRSTGPKTPEQEARSEKMRQIMEAPLQ